MDLSWLLVVAVASGGAVGAVLRYLSAVAAHALGLSGFPFATLFVNVSGSLALGFLTEQFATRWPQHLHLRHVLGVGLLGAFTTYSAFSVEVVLLSRAGRPAAALVYAVTTVLLCVGAALAGILMAQSWGGSAR